MRHSHADTRPFAGGATFSAAVHLAFIAAVLWTARKEPAPILPPVYRVNIVAAPAGPRAIGEVRARREVEPTDAAPRPTAEVQTQTMPAPTTAPTQARRVTPAPAAPQSRPRTQVAGGGPIGGRGTDVATVQTSGIEFPFPGYLNNIVRQIALRFDPPANSGRLRAEIMFLLHRDGSVTNLRFITRSGVYAFDLEAQGAIEAAAAAHAFGPLPEGFNEDVLPVSFSFDPEVLR